MFLGFSVFSIIIVSVISGDTVLGVLSSATGVAYTVCNGKGKRIAYVFGLINSILYAGISFSAQIYGDAFLYTIYYIPAMIVGFFVWKKFIDKSSLEVVRRRLQFKWRIVLVVICVAGTLIFWWALKIFTDDALPFLDAFKTFLSITATVLAIKRFNEQWVLWASVNFIEVLVWSFRFADGVENSAVSLTMWILFFVIGIVMWVQWSKKAK